MAGRVDQVLVLRAELSSIHLRYECSDDSPFTTFYQASGQGGVLNALSVLRGPSTPSQYNATLSLDAFVNISYF